MEEFNIVELMEKNPISKLSQTYNNNLLTKIKDNFVEFEQKLFVSSFYCYLNYDKNTDFVIDLDNVWKWLGFTQKVKAKTLLEKNFVVNKDYKILLCDIVKQVCTTHGGHNKEIFMLTIQTFKKFCLKAQTQKANEIHEYYIKLEEILQESIEEETDELRLQLQQKDSIILDMKQSTEQEKQKLTKEKQRAVEQAIVVQFPVNTECIYIGSIENTNDLGEKLLKFGHTNDLSTRVFDHRKKYTNFVLIEAFRVQNKVEIENLIKSNPKIKKQIRSIEVNGKIKTEIIAYDDSFTIARLSKIVKDIIHSKVYSIDNYNKIMKQNEEMTNEVRELREKIKSLQDENTKHILFINDLNERLEKQSKSLELIQSENDANTTATFLVQDNLTNKFDEFISTCCIVRNDVEVDSCDILAQFRIWNGVKPKRETNERLNTYLRTRFLASRLKNQEKDQCVHGFIGVMLKPIDYKKKFVNDLTEIFLFETCRFAPNNRIATNKLHDEFIRYKKKINVEVTTKELEELKTYLNHCDYVQKGTLHIQNENMTQEGYYGLALKTDNPNVRKVTSITGKSVQKIDALTGVVINSWESIVKASVHEKMSASKMSRSIKSQASFGDYYYKIAS
jgi:phage anti-repressor protein